MFSIRDSISGKLLCVFAAHISEGGQVQRSSILSSGFNLWITRREPSGRSEECDSCALSSPLLSSLPFLSLLQRSEASASAYKFGLSQVLSLNLPFSISLLGAFHIFFIMRQLFILALIFPLATGKILFLVIPKQLWLKTQFIA